MTRLVGARRGAVRTLLIAAATLGLASGGAGAQTSAPSPALSPPPYPQRPVTLVVPFPPGGTTDIVARLLAEPLGRELGQPVVVEARGGASTAIGAFVVARAPKDGHTLLMGTSTTFSTNPHLVPDLKYGPKDFAPVAMLNRINFAFVVRKGFPAADLPAFRAYALAHPGAVNNATNGPGTVVDIFGALIGRELGVRMQQVHYRGAAPAMNDVMAGVVDSNVEALANAAANHRAGAYRALAVLSEARLPQLPEVPTFAELGYPGVVGQTWSAIFAPAGTPPAVVARLGEAITGIVRSPTFRARMEELGCEAVPMGPDELAAYVRADSERLSGIIRDLGIKLE